MGESRTSIVLQWAEQWIGVDLVTGRSQETATVIVAQIVAERRDCAFGIIDVGA